MVLASAKFHWTNFPGPDELWQRYCDWKDLSDEHEDVVLQDYYKEIDGKTPRYYQRVAINRAVEAYVKGQKRMLLVMATGTGKTFTAFQIIWRLWKAGEVGRVLFLADRNILVDQAITNDFRPFGEAMTKITHHDPKKAFEIYLALYQGVTGAESYQDIYKDYSPDFFDLVIIDECHRGSAKANSEWRKILEYYDSRADWTDGHAKGNEDVSTQHYFGDPIYTYSLKQGINDGFLAPYKVIRVGIDRTWRATGPSAASATGTGRRSKTGSTTAATLTERWC